MKTPDDEEERLRRRLDRATGQLLGRIVDSLADHAGVMALARGAARSPPSAQPYEVTSSPASSRMPLAHALLEGP